MTTVSEMHAGGFTVVVDGDAQSIALRLAGELDLAGRPALRASALAVGAGAEVTVDLGGLTFLDVCGYRALTDLVATLRRAGAPVVVVVDPAGRMARIGSLLRPACHAA